MSGNTDNPEKVSALRESEGGGGSLAKKKKKKSQVLNEIELVTKWMDKQVEVLKNYPSKKKNRIYYSILFSY